MIDLVGGRVAWTVLGLPTEGQVGDARRVSQYAVAAPSVNITQTIGGVTAVAHGDWPTAIVSDGGVLLGSVAHTALALDAKTPVERVMSPAPATIRPDERIDDVMAQIQKDHLDHVFVTTADGVLVGIVISGGTHV